MPKYIRALAAVTLGFALGLVPVAAFASDASLPETLASELDGENIVVIEPAEISNLDLLEDKLYGQYFSLAVVTPSVLGNHDPEKLASFLMQEAVSGGDVAVALLVVDGRSTDSIYVASPTSELQAKVVKLLEGDLETSSSIVDDAGWEILRNADAISDAQDEFSTPLPAAAVIAMVSILLLPFLIALLGYNWYNLGTFFRKIRYTFRKFRGRTRWNLSLMLKNRFMDLRKRSEKRKHGRKQAVAERRLLASEATLPQSLRESLATLRARTATLYKTDEPMAKAVTGALARFSELQTAFDLMETPQHARNLVLVDSSALFEKLATLLSSKYYDDIRSNPEHWRNPETKLEAIRESFETVNERLLHSIISLKEGSELDLEVNIDSIAGFRVVTPRSLIEP